MTPKEKADKLTEHFIPLTRSDRGIVISRAKQCALIAVDETIEALNLLLKSGLNNDFDILKLRGFYMEVRKEIEKI